MLISNVKLVQYIGCKEWVEVPILEEHHIAEVLE
jgi:hypothetical protein